MSNSRLNHHGFLKFIAIISCKAGIIGSTTDRIWVELDGL